MSSADIRAGVVQMNAPVGQPRSALQQIGAPEVEGYLRKKNDQFNGWKTRFVAFKNMNLYLLKTPAELKVKGLIGTMGYKVLPDPDSARGYYGFKMVHASKPTHYFSSDDPMIIRKFMKALTKSSITRDENAIVITTSKRCSHRLGHLLLTLELRFRRQDLVQPTLTH
jgi:hypothetical protein